MKSTTFVLGAFLASVAIAQPHKQHQARYHNRQDPETTVIVTDWVTDYETVGVTTTIWVSPGFVEPEVTSSSTPSTTTTIPKVSSSITPTAAQFFEPESTSSTKEAAPTPSTSSTSVSTSTSSPVYVAPTISTASSVYVAPVVESSSSSSSYVAPVVVPTTTSPAAPVYTAPAETTTSAAPAAATTASSNTVSNSGSTSGTCSSGSPCTGDITYYEAGLGACGLTNDGSTEKVVALPYGLMGTQSNGNPYCGKTITVSHGGKTTTATVVDKCMGCVGDSIDLSNAAFLELAELAVGRTSAEWWFN